MRRFIGLILLVVTASLIYFLDTGKVIGTGYGKLLSPTHGVWTDAPSYDKSNHRYQKLKVPVGTAEVFYDERGVPHIYASEEAALFWAQGYVQAADRLFQMDIQVRAAAGRLSEAIGERGLESDRYFRRLGMSSAADKIVDVLQDDPLYAEVVTSFTNGVNAYIDQLSPRDYPLEFKLNDYKPEHWTLKKSVLLLKLMAYRLSAYDTDVQNSNTLALIGRTAFDDLFPDFPTDQSPIIPSTTKWPFSPVRLPENPYEADLSADSVFGGPFTGNMSLSIVQKGIGSNNWAIGKSKTANGGAILCNDPHLGLSLPSIWYEMQLSAPGINVYGVTIPGSPCIIIGFNEEIAWGVTNGGRDVRDWYSIRYRDASQEEYFFEGQYRPIDKRIEKIQVANGETVIDTVRWTAVGPILFDARDSIQSRTGLAVRWLALETSNELKTFYYLNKARNHDDYLAALEHYSNPAQNFVFADRKGNVAIKQQGKFRVKGPDDGKFVEPLEYQSLERLSTYIPNEHNPYVLNPPRGFVSSANQHPTDSTYPYRYGGYFERYRNRRINALLDSMDRITVEDMKVMQNDCYNLMGKEAAPYLLSRLDPASLDPAEKAIFDTITAWNFINRYDAAAPAYFQDWFNRIKESALDELNSEPKAYFRIPWDYEFFEFLVDHPDHHLMDVKATAAVENADQLIRKAFSDMAAFFRDMPAAQRQWRYYNAVSVQYPFPFRAFSHFDLPIGGSENAINATNGNFGPSWRMVVSLNEDGVEAFGVYPGGPSGHPGDPNYDAFMDEWVAGEYFKLNFYRSEQEAKDAYEAGINKSSQE